MRSHWLIDDTLFVFNAKQDKLVMLDEGMPPRVLANSNIGNVSEISVVDDKLFFVYTINDGGAEDLYYIDPQVDILFVIENQQIIDAYQDWFA